MRREKEGERERERERESGGREREREGVCGGERWELGIPSPWVVSSVVVGGNPQLLSVQNTQSMIFIC